MRKVIVLCLAVCAVSISAATATKKKSTMKAAEPMIATTPEAMKWGDAPPFLEKGAQAVVLQGDPSKAGFFALRLRLPDGYRIAAHWHPTEERLTVISGTFHLAMGDSFDTSAGSATPGRAARLRFRSKGRGLSFSPTSTRRTIRAKRSNRYSFRSQSARASCRSWFRSLRGDSLDRA